MKKGLFIGLNTIDVQFLVDSFPHANEKLKAKDYGMYTGGPATNAAITFSHLGGKAHLISSFGQHAFTETIFKELQNFGVEYTDIIPNKICDPIFASIITSAEKGERSVISYRPDDHDFCDIDPERIQIDDYIVILVDGFYPDIAKMIIEKSKTQVPVVLDGGSWKKGTEELLPFVDIAICSAYFQPPGIKTGKENIKYLSNRGIEKIAITRGDKSILVYENNIVDEIPVIKIDAVDSLGAGDVFHGAFCYYYAENGNFKDSLTKASKVASHSCMYFGTREWMKEDIK